MACRGFLECVLKLLNFLMTLAGLAMVGYGIYLFVEYKQSSSLNSMPIGHNEVDLINLGRPFLALVTKSSDMWDEIYSAWFICAFAAVGFFFSSHVSVVLEHQRRMVAALVVYPNGCLLSQYAMLVMFLILVELGCAAFMFFDHNWEHEIPHDKTGNYHKIFDFLKKHWSTLKWVAIGIVVFEAVLFFLALLVKAENTPSDYDSDEEFINPSQPFRQPLINRPLPTGFAGAMDQRASMNDPWNARMREKYGVSTSDQRTYGPNYAQQNEGRGDNVFHLYSYYD
ncbi:LOW QUALITY PROTEIN: hypothetical protein V2J09_020375 [Rumex salicifolius]